MSEPQDPPGYNPETHTPVTPIAPSPTEADLLDEQARAVSLAQQLAAQRRHPVILFGASNSGKSTLLMSLLARLKLDPRFAVKFGAPIMPLDTAERIADHDYAQDFFERRCSAWMTRGVDLKLTAVDRPLFIPIDIQPSGDRTPIRVAFMEGRGEWSHPQRAGPMFLELRPEIKDVLHNYLDGISVVYMAPYTKGEVVANDTDECDSSLVGAIDNYLRERTAIPQDFHLMLLTKWDKFADPLAENPQFSIVEDEEVEAVLAERYPQAWASFQAMPVLGETVRRFFMQYSAAPIAQRVVRQPARRHLASFERYQQTVWNWILGNATQVSSEGSNASGTRGRRVLFPDVQAAKGVQVTFTQRIYNFLVLKN